MTNTGRFQISASGRTQAAELSDRFASLGTSEEGDDMVLPGSVHPRSNITIHWKPYFQRGLQGGKMNHKLKWNDGCPRQVLVLKKPDPLLLDSFTELVSWLVQEKNLVVFVEDSSIEESEKVVCTELKSSFICDIAPKLRTFSMETSHFTDKQIDLIICLGGDGTLLYASNLFNGDVPPILAFHMGSLGFLTPHKFEDFRDSVTRVLDNQAYFTMRSRLSCCLYKASNTQKECKQVMNEVVIDRGPSGSLCVLDLMIEDQTVTTVQGDGLIISTPTGSTAYAMAAGANMLHPSVPAVLVAPICPHSLSFRPIILPASTSIKIRLSEVARASAWVSFDGRDRQELLLGDSVSITTSPYMVPSICAQSPLLDWFSGLAECFHWNVRSIQRPFSHVNSTSNLNGLESHSSENSLKDFDNNLTVPKPSH